MKMARLGLIEAILFSACFLIQARTGHGDDFGIKAKIYLHEHGVAAEESALLDALRFHRDPVSRKFATYLLAESKNAKLIPAMEEALPGEKDDRVRCAFATAFLKLKAVNGLEVARKVLGDTKDLTERILLAEAMADAGSAEGFSVVEAAAQSSDAMGQYWATGALGSFMRPAFAGQLGSRPLEIILDRVRSNSSGVRGNAIFALVQAHYNGVSDPRMKQALERIATEDTDPYVRESAQRVLHLF